MTLKPGGLEVKPSDSLRAEMLQREARKGAGGVPKGIARRRSGLSVSGGGRGEGAGLWPYLVVPSRAEGTPGAGKDWRSLQVLEGGSRKAKCGLGFLSSSSSSSLSFQIGLSLSPRWAVPAPSAGRGAALSAGQAREVNRTEGLEGTLSPPRTLLR